MLGKWLLFITFRSLGWLNNLIRNETVATNFSKTFWKKLGYFRKTQFLVTMKPNHTNLTAYIQLLSKLCEQWRKFCLIAKKWKSEIKKLEIFWPRCTFWKPSFLPSCLFLPTQKKLMNGSQRNKILDKAIQVLKVWEHYKRNDNVRLGSFLKVKNKQNGFELSDFVGKHYNQFYIKEWRKKIKFCKN